MLIATLPEKIDVNGKFDIATDGGTIIASKSSYWIILRSLNWLLILINISLLIGMELK
jgi:hypothetical protein